MKVIFLSTLIILAGASVSPAYTQELLWESKEKIIRGNKETTIQNKNPLQWEAVTDTTRQLSQQSDSLIRTDNIVWEITPYSTMGEEIEVKNISKKTVIKSNHQPKKLEWITVTSETMIPPIEEEGKSRSIFATTQEIKTALQVRDNNSPTYASSRALWRNDRWHPQISFLIPNGYGPFGVMLEANVTGTDCTLGKGPCEPFTTVSEWQKSINFQANGSTYLNAGFGDTQSWGGILITNSFEQFASSLDTGGTAIGEENFLAGVQTGLHYAKAIGPDTSFRTGVENLITWDSKDYIFSDMTRNFYFVGSQRFKLKEPENSSKWFRNLYLTAGVGNGEFKPIEQTFKDQTKALKDAGCQTYGFTPSSPCSQERFKRALRTGSDYGQINPIGSFSLEVVDGLHLISEWSGRNLNAGFSWRPFQDIGFIITPMVESIVQNCEYPGCRVTPIKGYPEKVALPDVVFTERVRLSLQASFQIQF